MADLVLERYGKAIEGLRQILGNDNVLTDAESRALFATDMFRAFETPVAVIQPKSRETLAAAVELATRSGLAVVPRGGGLSYTDGYLSERPETVVVDTRHLNRILEINKEDLYVTVECGVTWKQLHEALKDTGLRPPFWGTGSGMFATVGGSLAQHALNYGSARHGMSNDSVLGLTVVLADGSNVTTGSAATPHNPSPFFRAYGPDITGLFLGDNGAMGIKVQATLRPLLRPAAAGFLSFEFADRDGFAAALGAIGRENVASHCSGFNPGFMAQRIKRQGLIRDLQLLKGIATSGRSLIEGLRDAAKVAMAGRRFLEESAYTIHMTVEGRDDDELRSGINALRRAVLAISGAKEIEPSVPRLSYGNPFPQPGLMVNDDTELWVSSHGIVPPSRVKAAVAAMDQYFADNAQLVKDHDIDWGWLAVLCSPNAVLIEPSFYYRDALNALHRDVLGNTLLSGIKGLPSNPDVRKAITKIRNDISQIFMKMGATHMQIGKFYPYRESRQPELLKILEAVKGNVDPKGLMNPGALGLR